MNETMTLADYLDTPPEAVDAKLALYVWNYIADDDIEFDTDDDGDALLTADEWEDAIAGATAKLTADNAA